MNLMDTYTNKKRSEGKKKKLPLSILPTKKFLWRNLHPFKTLKFPRNEGTFDGIPEMRKVLTETHFC